MTRLILTRHGHVDWIAPERFRGRAELALSELGRRQVEATAKRIAAAWRPAAVYTSPMSRAVDTGTAIAGPFGLTVQPIGGLNDIDYGEWQGLTRDEVRRRWPEEAEAWFQRPHLAATPGGETLAAVLTRATATLHDILRRHRDDTAVLVGHDSVNRVLLLHAMELPLSRYWHFQQEPCAVNDLSFVDGAFNIRTINETYHLAGL